MYLPPLELNRIHNSPITQGFYCAAFLSSSSRPSLTSVLSTGWFPYIYPQVHWLFISLLLGSPSKVHFYFVLFVPCLWLLALG